MGEARGLVEFEGEGASRVGHQRCRLGGGRDLDDGGIVSAKAKT